MTTGDIQPLEDGTLTEAVLSEPSIRVELTYSPLNALATMQHVRSPLAGATVLFAGTLFLFSYFHQDL